MPPAQHDEVIKTFLKCDKIFGLKSVPVFYMLFFFAFISLIQMVLSQLGTRMFQEKYSNASKTWMRPNMFARVCKRQKELKEDPSESDHSVRLLRRIFNLQGRTKIVKYVPKATRKRAYSSFSVCLYTWALASTRPVENSSPPPQTVRLGRSSRPTSASDNDSGGPCREAS